MNIVNINKENEERAIKWMERACAAAGVDLPEIKRSDPTLVMFEWRCPGHIMNGTRADIHMNRIGVLVCIMDRKTGLADLWLSHTPYSDPRLQELISGTVSEHHWEKRRKLSGK